MPRRAFFNSTFLTMIVFASPAVQATQPVDASVISRLRDAAFKYTATVVDSSENIHRNATIITSCLIAVALHVDISRKKELAIIAPKAKGRPIKARLVLYSSVYDFSLFRTETPIASEDTRIVFQRQAVSDGDVGMLYSNNLEGQLVAAVLPLVVNDAVEGEEEEIRGRYGHVFQPILNTEDYSPNGTSSSPVFLLKGDGPSKLIPVGLFQSEGGSTDLTEMPRLLHHFLYGSITTRITNKLLIDKSGGKSFEKNQLDDAVHAYRDVFWSLQHVSGIAQRCSDLVDVLGDDILNHYLTIATSDDERSVIKVTKTMLRDKFGSDEVK